MEPAWRRLRYEFGTAVSWTYWMGGLIADWRRYNDPVNAINRPSQMGPYWLYVSQASGMPIEERIWHDDPPATSFPACLAVKAAQRQGADQAEAMLRSLREAVMLERRNVARREVLVEVAREAAEQLPAETSLDAARVQEEMFSDAVIDDFRRDLQEASYRGIQRFPSLIFKRQGARPVVAVGCQSYAAIRSTLEKTAPNLEPIRGRPSLCEYLRYWRRMTARELAEGLQASIDETQRMLDEALARRELRTVQGGKQYEPAG